MASVLAASHVIYLTSVESVSNGRVFRSALRIRATQAEALLSRKSWLPFQAKMQHPSGDNSKMQA
jgi:predicted amidohydrolase